MSKPTKTLPMTKPVFSVHATCNWWMRSCNSRRFYGKAEREANVKSNNLLPEIASSALMDRYHQENGTGPLVTCWLFQSIQTRRRRFGRDGSGLRLLAPLC